MKCAVSVYKYRVIACYECLNVAVSVHDLRVTASYEVKEELKITN
jgi:hypothetical protein